MEDVAKLEALIDEALDWLRRENPAATEESARELLGWILAGG